MITYLNKRNSKVIIINHQRRAAAAIAPIATDPTTEKLFLNPSLFAFDGDSASEGGSAIYVGDGEGESGCAVGGSS